MNPWLVMLIFGLIALLLSILILRPVEKAEKEAKQEMNGLIWHDNHYQRAYELGLKTDKKASTVGDLMRIRCEQVSKDAREKSEKAYQKYIDEYKDKQDHPDLHWTVKQINIKTGNIECHVSYPTLKEAQDKGAEWLKPYPGIPQDHYVAIFADNRIQQAAGNELIPLESFGPETMKAIRGK